MKVVRKLWFLLFVACWALTWVPGCGGGGGDGDGDGDADGDADGDGDGDGDNVLEFVSARDQFLQYNSTADLTVRYLDGTGSPITGAQIDYAISGDAGGSSLPARSAQTDANGQANMVLTSGNEDAAFEVVVTPPLGNSLSFVVTVSGEEVGSIEIRMSYDGEQLFTEYRPFLWVDAACADIDPDSPPTAEIAGTPVNRLSDRPRFDGLEPASNYTVGVIAIVDGAAQGFGCNQGVTVTGNQVTEVAMELLDIERPVFFDGTYELESYIDFADVLPPSVQAAVSVFDELTDDAGDRDPSDDRPTPPDQCGQDPGAFLVDIVMRQTCHWECLPGEDDYDSCSNIHDLGDICLLYERWFGDTSWDGAASRFFGGCGVWEYAAEPVQDFINDQIARLVPSFITNFIAMIGDLSRAINNAHLYSLLTLQPAEGDSAAFSHVLTEMQVRLRDLDGAFHEYRFNLDEVGLSTLEATETASLFGSTLVLPDHSFQLHFGELIKYIYIHGLLREVLGYEDTAAMLADWIDCATIAGDVDNFLQTNFGFSPGIGALEGYCDAGLELGGAYLEDQIVDLVDETTTLTLAGTADAGEIDDEYFVQTLVDGVWEGEWTEGALRGDVTGTFTGARR